MLTVAVPPGLETAPAVMDIGLILLLAVLAGWIARRLGLPAVLGYLAVGFVVSPFTPGYVADRHQLELLADVGVVLLLFEVGIEIDPLTLGTRNRRILWAAPAQVVITALLSGAGAALLGITFTGASLVGLSIAMSSSVVVVGITRSRRATADAPTREALMSWSVLQDMSGVLISLLLLAVFGLASRPAVEAAVAIVVYLGLCVVAAWVLPRALARLHSEHDLFLLLSVGSGLAIAGIGASLFGVPLALAAFIAGLTIGESPVAAEARRRIVPFRDLFAVLFFVSLGTLLDPKAVPGALPWVVFVLIAVVAGKQLPVYVLSWAARLRDVNRLQLATGLGQVGEFSFVLATIVVARNLIPNELFTAIIVSVVLTIAVSTVAVRLVGRRRDAAAPVVG